MKDVESWFLKLIQINLDTQYYKPQIFAEFLVTSWFEMFATFPRYTTELTKLYKRSPLRKYYQMPLKNELALWVKSILGRPGRP